MTNSTITKYQEALKKRNTVRTGIMAALLLVLLVFGLKLYTTVGEFRNNGIKEFSAAISKDSQPLLANIGNQLPQVASKVIPVYAEKITSTLNAKLSDINKAMMNEWAMLEQYGQNIRPEFDKKLRKMIENQEDSVKNELSQILGTTPDDAVVNRITFDYHVALENKLNTIYNLGLKEQMDLAVRIRDEASKLATTHGADVDVDLLEGTGIILEIIGQDLQEK